MLNSKKLGETFDNLVNSNKAYFEHISTFGDQIKDRIEVKFPEIEDKFVEDVELDKAVVDQAIITHLYREGHKDSASIFVKESEGQQDGANTQSFQDEFEALNEIIKDLNNHTTESALRWAFQNLKQITTIGGQNFVFKIHQANYRQMLHKAVQIHFEMNY